MAATAYYPKNMLGLGHQPIEAWSGLAAPPNSPSRSASPLPRRSKRLPSDDADDDLPIPLPKIKRRRNNSLGWEPRLASLALDNTVSLPITIPSPTLEDPSMSVVDTTSVMNNGMDEESSGTSEDERISNSTSLGLTFHPALMDRLHRLQRGPIITPASALGLALPSPSPPSEQRALILYRPLLPPTGAEPPETDESEAEIDSRVRSSWSDEPIMVPSVPLKVVNLPRISPVDDEDVTMMDVDE